MARDIEEFLRRAAERRQQQKGGAKPPKAPRPQRPAPDPVVIDDVEILDDCYDPITYEEDCDMVAMSFMSHQAGRAYQLSEEYRKRGKTVVLGGFHVTLDHREPLQFCDAVEIEALALG